MFHVLTHNILPVFAMLALGFAMGRTNKTSLDEARTLNRIAFLVLQPALIYPLLAEVDFSAFHPGALALYATSEVVMFLLTFALMRYVLKIEKLEAWLLGMAVVFVNSLLYIWPISALIYGPEGNLPIKAVVVLDASISFAFFIISTEIIAGQDGLKRALHKLRTHPILLAILLGAAVNLSGLTTPAPLMTAADFAGAAAAPMTLFALGVTLSSQPLRPTRTVAAVSALKLFGFPLVVFAAFWTLAPVNPWVAQLGLNAAGPSGAMAFSLAMLHGVKTDAIGPVIIWTSILSLISLAVLA